MNNTENSNENRQVLRQRLIQLRGDPQRLPDASIVIPVNAKSDMDTVLTILSDVGQYSGPYALEIVLVINNYPDGEPPAGIDIIRSLGVIVVAVANARRPHEVVIMSARALGVEAATSEITIHLDADCRILNVNALLNWYVQSLNSNAQLAYSHVGYYDLRNIPSVYAKVAAHHTARWIKRSILRIPTTRGSNYAITRSLFQKLYMTGKLSVDLQVGPAAKLAGSQIVYSNHHDLRVLTSGRRFRGGWLKMLRYFFYRLRYNLKAIPIQGREVTATNWQGFDQESENRKKFDLFQ